MRGWWGVAHVGCGMRGSSERCGVWGLTVWGVARRMYALTLQTLSWSLIKVGQGMGGVAGGGRSESLQWPSRTFIVPRS